MLNLISGHEVEDLASLHGLSTAVANPGFVKEIWERDSILLLTVVITVEL